MDNNLNTQDSINKAVLEIAKQAKEASYSLANMTSDAKNNMLKIIADAIEENEKDILEANKIDLAEAKALESTLVDRLTLNKKRIQDMAMGVRTVALIEDPIGQIVEEWKVKKSKIRIKKVRAPLGVIGVIYEARPNVTIDVVALAIKSGNAVVLRGGSSAINTNTKLYEIMKIALEKGGYSSKYIGFIAEKDREATKAMLSASKYIDVIIPRGGEMLKKFVSENTTIPVIVSGGGNCHIYVEKTAKLKQAKNILFNAKMQRPTVCNAVEQLIVDREFAELHLKHILEPLHKAGCILLGDEASNKIYSKVKLTTLDKYYEEHLNYVLSIKIVNDYKEAIAWINEHSTHHSDAIISQSKFVIEEFSKSIDSACVYVNTSTRFTDGFEFGYGAEIGISTQKLHARGPMGLKQLTSEKYVVDSDGAIRS